MGVFDHFRNLYRSVIPNAAKEEKLQAEIAEL